MAKFALLFAFGLLATCQGREKSSNITLKYDEVISILREISDPDVIPIEESDPKPVEVRLEQSLLYIAKVDEKSDLIEIVVKQWYHWWNKALAWDRKSPYTKVDNVSLPLRYLWSPDVTPSSAVHEPERLSPELAIVSCDGEILFESQQRLTLHADLRGLKSSSGATVSFIYESWTYDNTKLKLSSSEHSGFISDDFESKHYRVSNTTVSKHFNKYPPSENDFDVLNFSFNLKFL